MQPMSPRDGITRYAWLSVLTAVVIILLKVGAYWLTGSIGFLSDALESGANIIAAVITLVALTVAARPPDREHTFGHSKAEYLSAGAEGTLILVAAVVIAVQAVQRLLAPQPLAQVGLGVAVSAVAAAVNFGVARVLLRAGQRHRSTALTADAHHLLTDVWTSLGVIVAVTLVGLTGWLWLDPVIGLPEARALVDQRPARYLTSGRRGGEGNGRSGRLRAARRRLSRPADAASRGAALRVVPLAGSRFVERPAGT